jgi:DNA repair protein RadA/Sms
MFAANAGHVETKWLGRCPECSGGWNTFEEEAVTTSADMTKSVVLSDGGKAVPLKDVQVEPGYRFSTGISELDRVLGGGVMKGSSVLIGGEPGIGKSTLMLQMASLCIRDRSILYVSGEESPGQVKLRGERLGLDVDRISIFCDTRVEAISEVLKRPNLRWCHRLPADVGFLRSPFSGGSVNQIRATSTALVGMTKRLGISLFLIGHITKEGILAGPKVIEHLVDTVLSFEQSGSGVRIIRALKNRFGSVDELGIFTMGEKGLEPVRDPSLFFISQRAGNVTPPGIAYTAVTEGSRTFIVEIPALTRLDEERVVSAGSIRTH